MRIPTRPARLLGVAVLALALQGCDERDPLAHAETIRSQCLANAAAPPADFPLGASWEPLACEGQVCGTSLRFESVCVTFQTVDAYGRVVQLNQGMLTAAAADQATALAEALVGVDVPGVVDACDGECPSGFIALQREGELTLHDYVGAPPAELAGVAQFLDDVRDALAECKTNEAISIAHGCERAP